MTTEIVQASNEFELEGQRVVLIDTPGFNGVNVVTWMDGIKAFLEASYVKFNCGVVFLLEVGLIEALRYPTGTKLAGILYVQTSSHTFSRSKRMLCESIEILKELCEDTTLKNVVVMTTSNRDETDLDKEHPRDALSHGGEAFYPAIERGARVFPDLGGLKFILRGRDINKLEESMQKAMDKKVGKIRRELEESMRKESVQKAIDKKVEELRQEMEESIRKESMQKGIDKKVEELRRELEESIRRESHREREEEKRRAREEADGFRKCIAELQSKLEEDRHGSGKALRHT